MLFVLLFVGTAIGWFVAHITRDFNSSPVSKGEFVHPWNNHGATLYMTARQKYWVETFDKLSNWAFMTWVAAFACWVGFAVLGKERH